MGELLTVWMVRLAVGCYLGRYLADAAAARSDKPRRLSRWLWTVGCLLFLLHVLCAFAFVHHWSHRAAYADTARQTRDVVGWDWGGGLYFNYAFTLVWLADVVRLWRNDRAAAAHSRRVTDWLVHLFLAFMVFNATVVFGPPWWEAAAAGYAVLLAALLWRRRRRRATAAA